MRKLAVGLGLVLALWLGSPLAAQPLLEGAERFVPAIEDGGGRRDVLSALARGYAQHGSFEKAQALIDKSSPSWKGPITLGAANGALRAGHVEQALTWARQVLPKQEIAWDTERALALGSDRERFLATAPTPEAAARVLKFLRGHGGVSAQALAFVNQQSKGLPPLVSEFYFRQLEAVADDLRPIDWAGIEESLEYAGADFSNLRDQALRAVVEDRAELVSQLHAMGLGERAVLESRMTRYGAILLARRGRFEEAAALWAQAGAATPQEETIYLQNQYLGGRAEALDDLIARGALAEDAKVDLSLFLLGLGQIGKARDLAVEPEAYLNLQQARRDLGRGLKVDEWLDFLDKLDLGARPEDRRMREVAVDQKMPAQVREKAYRRLPDESLAQESLSQRLATELAELASAPSDRVSLQLLALDEYLRDQNIALTPENLESLQEFCSRAPKP